MSAPAAWSATRAIGVLGGRGGGGRVGGHILAVLLKQFNLAAKGGVLLNGAEALELLLKE